jgi:hypothetical protein
MLLRPKRRLHTPASPEVIPIHMPQDLEYRIPLSRLNVIALRKATHF